MNILVGKTVTAIYIAEDKKAIRFDVAGEESIVAKCDADCCSYTWIEHVTLPALGFPFLVLAEKDVEMPEDMESDGGTIQFYGFALETDKGDFLIDYRNSSNGYYGGSLAWPDDYFYGGVFKQNVSEEKWRLVAQDM